LMVVAKKAKPTITHRSGEAAGDATISGGELVLRTVTTMRLRYFVRSFAGFS